MSEQPTPQSWTDSLCINPATPYHTLDCRHIIFTPSSTTKSPCSPNCLRAVPFQKPQPPLPWLKNTSLGPFICPQCVVSCIRQDYDDMLQQHPEKSARLASAKETDVRSRTYMAIVEMAEAGGRICEDMSGLFKVSDIEAYYIVPNRGPADRIESNIEGVNGSATWKVRDTPRKDLWTSKDDAMFDTNDAGQTAMLQQMQSQPQVHELDELADWLGDARVGISHGDVEMEDLSMTLEAWET